MTHELHLPLCPEGHERARMDDDAFWERVLRNLALPGGAFEDDEPPSDNLPATVQPCPECGEVRACAWDAEGRPLVHALPIPTGEDS